MHLHSTAASAASPSTCAAARAARSSATSRGAPTSSSRRCVPARSSGRGLGSTDLRPVNPRIVFVQHLRLRRDRALQGHPSHGIAYDTWAGISPPAFDDDGFSYIPEHVSIGIYAGPLYGALAILAAVIRARDTGDGADLELAQSDARPPSTGIAASPGGPTSARSPRSPATPSDNYERRAPGTGGMREGVRYQIYAASDGYVLFMASEQAFWKNFCEASTARTCSSAGRARRSPITRAATGAAGRAARRSSRPVRVAEWIEFGGRANTPIAPVNTPKTIVDDPQFRRTPAVDPEPRPLDGEQLPFPLKFVGEDSAGPDEGTHGRRAHRRGAARRARLRRHQDQVVA